MYLAAVLLNQGFKVYLYEGFVATPLVPWCIEAKGCCGGVMVTASHNPKQVCASHSGERVCMCVGGWVRARVCVCVRACVCERVLTRMWVVRACVCERVLTRMWVCTRGCA